MKKKIMTTLSAAALILSGCEQKLPQLGVDPIEDVIAAMTNEEKTALLIGRGMAGATGTQAVVGANDEIIPGAAGTTHAIPRLGIPSIVLADGPAGLRIKPDRPGSSDTYYCTAFPIATALSSTWNPELVEQVGKSMGEEVLEYGVDVILGPGVNIHRNPLCGRNYEYYSEDPVLAGKTAASIIKGIQSNNVGTSIKHFAANNQETLRTKGDSRVSQRAMREIYLKQFEIAIKESEPWTVMTSYNYLNGTYTSESKELNQTILRDEWGFKGLVMTDWFAGSNTVAQVESGNDLLMPGVDRQTNELLAALNNGSIDMKAVDANVKRVLELIMRTPRFKGYEFKNNPDLKAHAAITRQAAAEGSVLLVNQNNALPVSVDKVKNVALFGVTSYDYVSGGVGSGDVNEEYTVSLYDGFKNAGFNVDENLNTLYAKIIADQKEEFGKKDSMVFRFVSENPEFSIEDIKKAETSNDMAVITIGRVSGEFQDRRIANFYLTDNEKALLNNVAKVFKAKGKKVVVILNTVGVIETASWCNIPDAVLCPWMGGQEGGNAVVDILTGKVNPSGRLPMSFPIDYFDVPGAKDFPYDIQATPNTLFGVEEENHVERQNVDFTNYIEDIFVGYRYYNTFEKKTAFPFGYGLSYTKFEMSHFTENKLENGYEILVDVDNVGSVEGKTVVQFYVDSRIKGRPTWELKNFAKTISLKPGESQTVKMFVPYTDLYYFDEANSQWILPESNIVFGVGDNAENITLTHTLKLSVELSAIKVNDVLKPQASFDKLSPESK